MDHPAIKKVKRTYSDYWKSEYKTESEANALSPQDVQLDDVEYKRETDHKRKGWKNCCKLTHNGIDDGSAKMPMAL
jgi:hypothetical protein